MRFPQVSDRVKEAPAQALRGVFAGIGQLLLFTDKLRNKAPAKRPGPAGGAVQPTVTALDAGPDLGPGPAGRAKPEPAAEPAPAAGPEPAEAVGPEPAEAVGPEPAEAVGAADLPLPNYDELPVASLRARLRNLDVGQLRQLISYEQAHADRQEVISMYERRIGKLEDERRDEAGEAAAEAEIEARAEVEDAERGSVEAEVQGEE